MQLLADHAARAASNLDHRPGGKIWRMGELLRASAVAQAAAIREGRVSSEELVRAQLGRIAAVNPALNGVVQVNGSALAQARTADEARAVAPSSARSTACRSRRRTGSRRTTSSARRA